MVNRFNFILLSSLMLFASCQRSPSRPVLAYGDRAVTLPEFKDRYREFLDLTHLKDNLQFRYNYGNGLLDELAILSYADAIHYTDRPEVQEEFRRIVDQIVLNRLYETELEPELEPTETDLRRLFVWSQYRLHVQHLFCRTESQAREVADKLAAGADWDALAEELFADSALAHSGGDLGFIVLGDMDPAFEVVAFSLIDGEISQPVQTEYGYSIIRVVEREVDPFLIETDFQQKRKRLARLARSHKKRPLVRQYTDEVLAELDVVFLPGGRDQLFTLWQKSDPSRPEISFPDGEQPCLIIQQTGETRTVAEAFRLLRQLSPRQARLLHRPEQLEQALLGLIARQALLERARRLGLERDDEVIKDIQLAQNTRIIKNIISELTAQFPRGDIAGRRTRYTTFRDSLRRHGTYRIDSTQIKSFTLTEPA